MGLFDRFRKSHAGTSQISAPSWGPPAGLRISQPAAGGASLPPSHELLATLPAGTTVAEVGESYYEEAFIQICGPKCADGYVLETLAELRPEPNNPYDAQAIAVHVQGLKVGHLSREEARASRALIDRTIATHHVAVCGALIRGGWDRGSGDAGHFGVWLQFSTQPDALPSLEPGEFRLAPGGDVSVSHEEHYQDVLVDAAASRGMTGSSCATVVGLSIAGFDPWRKTSSGEVIEVRIGGSTAGFLTPAMTARYRPVVDRALTQHRHVTAEASIFRSYKKTGEVLEVRLNAGDPVLR